PLNAPLSGTITTTLYGLAAIGERWVRVQYPYVSGLQDSVVEIQDADIDLLAGRITFTFILVFPEILQPFDPDARRETPAIPPSIKREDGSSLFREDGSLYLMETA